MSSAAHPLPVDPATALRTENTLLRRRVEELELRAKHWGPLPVAEETLSRLREAYEGIDGDRVGKLLATHPVIAPTLLDAVPYLHAAFGDGITLRRRPPVFLADGDPLSVEVDGHGLGVEAATEREERFAATWWDAQPFERREWLLIGAGFARDGARGDA